MQINTPNTHTHTHTHTHAYMYDLKKLPGIHKNANFHKYMCTCVVAYYKHRLLNTHMALYTKYILL